MRTNLHSTMLLLYRKIVPDTVFIIPFTFHYASTLSLTLLCVSLCIVIYIPLCFYFIGARGAWMRTLITFTFHYASTLSIESYWSLIILNEFTFHYASTLSKTFSSQKISNLIFTFHYASTLSTIIGDRGNLDTNLHSTMLLLYQDQEGQMVLKEANLHSTMLLLYQVIDVSEHQGVINIYIPLCFYFIRHAGRNRKDERTDLHSTMLLLYPRSRLWRMRIKRHLHSTMLLLYRKV